MKDITKENINEVLQNELPVIIDFWAPWCGYCKRLMPAMNALEGEYDGKVLLTKLNIDDFEEISDEFEVDTIPTLIAFKNGVEVKRVVNPESKSAVEDFIDELIK